MNNEGVPRTDCRGKIIAKLGRHVISFVRVREFAAAQTRELHVVEDFSHEGMGLDSQALVGAVERLQNADSGRVRKLLQVDGVGRMLRVESRPVQPFYDAAAC